MATKLYFHAATPTFGGTLPSGESAVSFPTWSATAANTLRTMTTTIGSSQASLGNTTFAGTTVQRAFLGHFASTPLAGDQTVGGGAMTFFAAEQESNTAAAFLVNSVNIYVWRPSTGTKVGTVLDSTVSGLGGTAPTAQNSEQSTYITAIASTAVAALTGDIVVCEVWSNLAQTMSTSYSATFYYDGTTESTTENQVLSSAASYIQLAENLVFQQTHTTSLTEVVAPDEDTAGQEVLNSNTAEIAALDDDSTQSAVFEALQVEIVSATDEVNGGLYILIVTDGTLNGAAIGALALNASSQGIQSGDVAEVVVANSSATLLLVFAGASIESLALVDVLSAIEINVATVTEAAPLTESLVRTIITNAISNNIAAAADTMSASSVATGLLNEVALPGDTVSGYGGKDVFATETITALELSGALVSFLTTCAEAFSAQTTQAGAGIYPVYASEPTVLGDAIARAVAAARATVEPVTVADVRTAILAATGSAVEAASMGHEQITVNLFTGFGTEPAATQDTSSAIGLLQATRAESNTISDAVSAIATMVASRSEGVAIDDQYLAQTVFTALLSERVLVLDNNNRFTLSPVRLEAFIGTGMAVLVSRLMATVSVQGITASVEVLHPIQATAEVQYVDIQKAA